MRAVNSKTMEGERPPPIAVPWERTSTIPCFIMTARQIYRQTYMAYPHTRYSLSFKREVEAMAVASKVGGCSA